MSKESDFINGQRRTPGSVKTFWKRIVDGVTDTAALAEPSITQTSGEWLKTGFYPRVRLWFGGTDAENETVNYQVVLWSTIKGADSITETFVPTVVAKGVATLGAKTYGAAGTDLGAATNLIADTITETLNFPGTLALSPGGDSKAILEIDVRNALYLEVQTDLDTAASVDVFAQKGDTIAQMDIEVIVDSASGLATSANQVLEIAALDAQATTVHAEDEAYTATDAGTPPLAVRKDARAQAGSAADGDYVPMQTTANGDLRTRDDDANVDLDTIVTTVHVEDEAYTAADAGLPPLAVRKDSRAQAGSAADGDYVPLQTTANGDLRTRDDDANTDLDTLVTTVHVEDEAYTAADAGLPPLMVRKDARAQAGSAADGDYVPLQGTANGDLRVKDDDAVTELAKLTLVDDAAFTPATSTVVPVGLTFDDTTPDSIDEGDIGAQRMSANRNAYETIRDGAGNERGANVTAANELNTLETNSGAIKTAVEIIDDIVVTRDTAAGAADKGVMSLVERRDDASSPVGTDGDYSPMIASEHGCLHTDPQHYLELADTDSVAGWTAFNSDTIAIATSVNHIIGTNSIEFDKVDGAANTVIAAIQNTISSISLSKFFEESGGFLMWQGYVSSVSDIVYAFIRLGTDSSNYNEWRVDAESLQADWNNIRVAIGNPTYDGSAGNGWDSSAVTYICVGFAFDTQNNTLADIAIDGLQVNSGLQTSSDITEQISSSVTTANVNMQKIANKVANVGAGNVGTGTQRIVNAADGPDVVSLAIMDDWDESDRAKVNLIVGQPGIAAGAGAVGVTVPRMTLASNDPAVASLALLDDVVQTDSAAWTPTTDKVAMVGAEFDDAAPAGVAEGQAGALRMSSRRELYAELRDAAGNERGVNITASNELNVLDSNSGNIKTAVELLDDVVKVDDAAFTPGTDKIAMIGAQCDDTSPGNVDEGDAGAVRMTPRRGMHTNPRPERVGAEFLLLAVDNTADGQTLATLKGGALDTTSIMYLVVPENSTDDCRVNLGNASAASAKVPFDGLIIDYDDLGTAKFFSTAGCNISAYGYV